MRRREPEPGVPVSLSDSRPRNPNCIRTHMKLGKRRTCCCCRATGSDFNMPSWSLDTELWNFSCWSLNYRSAYLINRLIFSNFSILSYFDQVLVTILQKLIDFVATLDSNFVPILIRFWAFFWLYEKLKGKFLSFLYLLILKFSVNFQSIINILSIFDQL